MGTCGAASSIYVGPKDNPRRIGDSYIKGPKGEWESSPETRANARLMALSPELLDTVQSVFDFLNNWEADELEKLSQWYQSNLETMHEELGTILKRAGKL